MTESTSVPATSEPAPDRWRQATPRVFEALAVNAVPLWGLLHGWSLSTLLVLYWCENLLNTFFIGGRIWLHRKLTRKRGHWTTATVRKEVYSGGKLVSSTSGTRPSTLLREFVFLNLIFTLGHGVFAAALIFKFLPEPPGLADLGRGLLWLVVAMSASFGLDAARIRAWPFAWIRARVDAAMGRIFVVHLGLLGGFFLLAITRRPAAFFAVFIGFKLLLELTSALPKAKISPSRAPRWLGWMRRFGKPGEFEQVWQLAASDEQRKEREAEEVLDHVPT